ncbi:MAG: TonB-dependent receptor [Bacteroidetes bacterium]|nr:TonB-dependent receptor [Bacteroidota bacterium]
MEVRANLVPDNSGYKKVKFDSLILLPYRDADLSTVLSQISTIFIKSYSPGSLATTSFRGTPANHTQVEWNGLSLSNPMLGQSDLSQIPVSAFDEIEVLYGASGLTKTSGAFGGVVNLVTNPDWNNRIHASIAQTFASFDNYTTEAGFIGGTSSFQSHTRLNFTSAVNDFSYYDDFTMEKVTQHDAEVLQYGITEEAFWKLKDKHLFTARVWYSYDDRDIPPVVEGSATYYPQKMLNKTLRSIIEYKLVERSWNFSLKTSLVNQFMNYRNDSMFINNDHNCYTSFTSARFSWTGVKNLTIKPGLDYTYDYVKSDAYSGVKTRNTLGFYLEAGYRFNDHIKSQLILREDYLDGAFMPFIPTLGLEYKPFNKINLYLNANASRNYRYPTLNDLYWELWGNPDLKPEYDNGLEGGITYNYPSPSGKFFIETALSGYYSWMHDMIVWSPVPVNPSVWKPQNVSEVNARGIEASLNLKWKVSKLQITSSNNYTFCRSTYQKTTSPEDQSLGKQLIYIPEDTYNGTLNLSCWNFILGYNLTFVNKRYTSPDNQSYMPWYSLSNIIFGKSINLHNFVISLQVKVNNLFDVDYQSVTNWPMPGRNYSLTVRFEFKR